MKKWFACLAVAGLLFSAGVGVSHAESWYALDTDQNGRTGYIDNDSVDKNDADKAVEILNNSGVEAYILGELVNSDEGVIIN